MEYKKPLSKIMCRICKEQFDQPKALFKHLQQKHDAGPAVKEHRNCSICGVQCTKNELYRDHMLHIHGQRTESQKLTFKSLNDFLLWKVELERKYNCQYVLQSAPKLLPTNERKYFYQCDRSEQDRPKSRERRITSITKKSCSSMILVLEGTGILKVEYWDNHTGHTRNLQLAQSDEVISAISTLEMMQEVAVQDFDDNLSDSYAYNADLDSSSPLTKCVKQSARKRGRTTTSNLTSAKNVIRTFYSPSNSGLTQKKPTNSGLFSLASVACGKINKNIISEKRMLNTPAPTIEKVSCKKSSDPDKNSPKKKFLKKDDAQVALSPTSVFANSTVIGSPSTSSSTANVTTASSSSDSVTIAPSSTISETTGPSVKMKDVISPLCTDKTASLANEAVETPSVKDATVSSSLNEAAISSVGNESALSSLVIETNPPSPVKKNDESSLSSDIDTSSPVHDIDSSSPGDESDTSTPVIGTKVASAVKTKSISSPVNQTAASSSEGLTKTPSSTNAVNSSPTTSTTKSLSSLNNVNKSPSTVGTARKSSSSTPLKSCASISMKASNTPAAIVNVSSVSNLVQSSAPLRANLKNPVAPMILSNSTPLSSPFYVLGPAIGTQSSFNTNLSNVILCPAGQNILAPGTVINSIEPTSLAKNINEKYQKRKPETENSDHGGPDMKKKPSVQGIMKNPVFGSIIPAARILSTTGSNQNLTNFISSPQLSSATNLNNNANNKIVLNALPPMTFMNINNQLIPINTSGTPLSAGSAPILIGQPPVAYNLSSTNKALAPNVVKKSSLNSVESENQATSTLKPLPIKSISTLAGTPISSTSVSQTYGIKFVKDVTSNPPVSTSVSKSPTTIAQTVGTKSLKDSSAKSNVENAGAQKSMQSSQSGMKKKLIRTKLDSGSDVSTPKKRKNVIPTANLTVSPIKTNDKQNSSVLVPSIVARTISSVVKENTSSLTTSIAGVNTTNTTLSKVISFASQIAKTIGSSKTSPVSSSNVSEGSVKAMTKSNTRKDKLYECSSQSMRTTSLNISTTTSSQFPILSSTINAQSAPLTPAPSIVIPPIPTDSELPGTFLFESAGNVYMLQPVETDDPKTDDAHRLSEIISIKNRTVGIQTVSSAKYSYFNNFSKSTMSLEKTNVKDDSEILKKVKYYQLEMNYLSSQEECKRLKIELAKIKLKNKELSEKLEIETQPSACTNHIADKKDSCIQAEELIKALEKRCGSDQDDNVYTLMRTSVLRSLYQDIQELSDANKQQYNELKSYRGHDKFYKFLKQKLEDGEH